MTEILGIDAGGTKTVIAAIAPDASLRRFDLGPSLDPMADADAPDRLRACLADCGQPLAATLGLPYHGEVTQITASQTNVTQDILGHAAKVENDVASAHRGAFAGGGGVLVLAGTGAMAWATGPKGTTRSSGYGDIFGDEGSAFWIGRRALAHAASQIDGRLLDDGFAQAFCAQTGIGADKLIDWVYSQSQPRTAIGQLARAVSALADAGDTSAHAILMDAAGELARAAKAAQHRSGLHSGGIWSYAGGVFNAGPVLDQLTVLMGTSPAPPVLPPIGGALLDAAQRAGWTITHDWVAALAANLAAQANRHALKAI
ncbi:N-acetylglucosamine kinase [Halovulum sp. GXIMD14793]